MDEGVDSLLRSDLTRQQFQQQLNRWFERFGILDNLRSHLRSLMIAALQQTEMGAKPNPNTSPRAQAVDLVVAEHLLKRGCHYTLSILTSEIPVLASFGSGAVLRRCKSRNGDTAKFGAKDRFKENEVIEILNALGMASSEERIQDIWSQYVQNREEESLLESLLGLLSKNRPKQNLARCWHGLHESLRSLWFCKEATKFTSEIESRNRLSKEWSDQVSDLLMKVAENPSQIPTAKELLRKITEREICRIAEEESRTQMMVLIQRERRIQECLRRREDEILERLRHAEKELDTRRRIIDKELTERQLHLGRIAFHWKSRHSEILALSKNFADVKTENKALTAKVDEMEAEMEELKLEIKKKAEVAERLEAEKMSFKCRMRECLGWKSSKKEEHEIKDLNSPAMADTSVAAERAESDSSDCEKPPSEFPSLEEVIARARSRIQTLEEENTQLSESYFKYRRKYEHATNADSEELKSDASNAADEGCGNVRSVEDKGIDATEPAGREDARPEEEDRDAVAVGVAEREDVQAAVPNSEPEAERKSLTPSKRQQKDHEYYLKSRNLLEMLEKGSVVVGACASDSTSDTSACCSDSNESSGKETAKAESESCPAASGEPLPVRTDEDAAEYGRKLVVGVSDAECLAILRKATHCGTNFEEERKTADEEGKAAAFSGPRQQNWF